MNDDDLQLIVMHFNVLTVTDESFFTLQCIFAYFMRDTNSIRLLLCMKLKIKSFKVASSKDCHLLLLE